MKIKQYMDENNLTYSAFAQLIGASNGKVIERYAKSIQIPHRKFMAEIARVTDGLVMPNDFYPECIGGTSA